jgi:hypothetical protein
MARMGSSSAIRFPILPAEARASRGLNYPRAQEPTSIPSGWECHATTPEPPSSHPYPAARGTCQSRAAAEPVLACMCWTGLLRSDVCRFPNLIFQFHLLARPLLLMPRAVGGEVDCHPMAIPADRCAAAVLPLLSARRSKLINQPAAMMDMRERPVQEREGGRRCPPPTNQTLPLLRPANHAPTVAAQFISPAIWRHLKGHHA